MTVRDETALVVFAKAPAPGAVKTRLVPVLGTEGAATLHADLVKRTLDMARAASIGQARLHCAPGVADPFFRLCECRYGVALEPQAEGDLGARMGAAFESLLATHDRVLLVGTDCPALTARHLRQAEAALREGTDAVFVPCEDGGYALIGLRRTDRRLFDDIAWGGGCVMADTRARLQQLGWTWRELETLWDIDRPEDYQRLIDSGLLAGRHATV